MSINPILWTLVVAFLPGVTPGCSLPASGGLVPVSSPALENEEPHFFYRPGISFGRPDRLALVNNDGGSPRVSSDADYERFWSEVAPLLREWALDPRLGINPAYVAALLTKESGFEQFATSGVPANGYPQITYIADADMLQMARGSAEWSWMLPELEAWPRHPMVHRADAEKAVTDSLVTAGAIGPHNSYLFEPTQATRAAVFWLRLLAEVWMSDEYPGQYNTFARARLNDGADLSDSQLLDLVTVSYNRGYTYAHDLIDRYGPAWKDHLNEEASDHLERIRNYTALYEAAGR